MIGAIIGDVVGSRFEFNNIKTKEFELIAEESEYTDDTVLTIAVMDWLLHAETKCDKTAVEYLQKWARKYPYAGYGGKFIHWKDKYSPTPYNSCGNGSAMRVSGVGWVSDNPDEVKLLSDTITEVTHNHPEGEKGAEAVAMCIYLALHGASKDEIKKRMVDEYYPEIASFDFDELVKTYDFYEICQKSCPQAIYCFLISNSLEDAIRNCIAIGGDCDTTGAMAGAIAEAFYQKDKVSSFENKFLDLLIDSATKQLIKKFHKTTGSHKFA